MLNVITEKGNFSEIGRSHEAYIAYCKVERVRRLLCSMLNVIAKAHFKFLRNENVNTVSSLEANRIEQVRIFMLLSRTEAIGSVTFVWNTVSSLLTFVNMDGERKLNPG